VVSVLHARHSTAAVDVRDERSGLSGRGCSDFVFTIAEHLLPALGLYRISRVIVKRHYANPNFRPGAKSLALARIAEKEGDYQAAEEYYREATQANSTEPDPYLFLGQFYERRERVQAAIGAYEHARTLATQEPELISALEKRLKALRMRPVSGGDKFDSCGGRKSDSRQRGLAAG
jgi:tetratricopeptide (TPR) repeat protein